MSKEAPPNYPGQNTSYPYPNLGQQAPQGATVVMPESAPSVVIVGGCPTCRNGILEDSYGCCAICLAICCFPVGLVCCYLMRERKCTNCGAIFH